jgi:predicted nucleic acid-binding protein
MGKIFFDTYALHEIVAKNPSYAPYTKNVNIVTTQLNLMELYYQLRFLYAQETAAHIINGLEEFSIPFTTETLIEAMEFRKLHSKKKMSYVDCIGYAISQKHHIPFLTGDKEFKDMPNVLFVK